MSIQEKQAWFILVVFAVAIVACLTLAFATGFHRGSIGALAIAGLAGFTPMIGHRKHAEGKVIFDERDIEIAKTATVAGYSAFWLVLVLAVMIPFFMSVETVRVVILP